MTSCQKINELLSGYLDDELTQADFQQVEVHLRSCSECKQVLDDMTKLKGAVAESRPREELDAERWEKIMNDKPAKASQGVGWLLLIAGAVALISYAIWEFAIDDEVQLGVKLAVSAVWFGVFFLFLSVVRQRMVDHKSDRYKDVRY